jgi:hypothetical protein
MRSMNNGVMVLASGVMVVVRGSKAFLSVILCQHMWRAASSALRQITPD